MLIRKPSPADNSFAELPWGASETYLNVLNIGNGFGLQQVFTDKLGFDDSLNEILCNLLEDMDASQFENGVATDGLSSQSNEVLVQNSNLPMGKPLCPDLPTEITGDAMQVLEFVQRFSNFLAPNKLILMEQFEKEFFAGSELNLAHLSMVTILMSELQAKVGAVVDPSSDIKDSKPKRGKKGSVDLFVQIRAENMNSLPVNELTMLEVTRRYVLAMPALDDPMQSGKVYGCLVGDGGVLCGSLAGVLGLEADALLLAKAMKKIFGSLKREHDILTKDNGQSVQLGACQSSSPHEVNIPEWAQLLEPVRKLPTNIGAKLRNCVKAALELSPPEWAKDILERSICKPIYVGNASGPTKRAVVSLLDSIPGVEGKKPVRERKKPSERRKGRNYASISDIIMRQCRIILRKVAYADSEKLLCTLLGRRLNHLSESDDKGILGSLANVSRPLDFRTIDLRLAAGAYDGSHEAFREDVQEFWNHVRICCGEKPYMLRQVQKLSSIFDALYEKEILAFHQKLVGYARLGCFTEDAQKEINSLSELPKAPWESSICKICGIDKRDELVLLCDTCDAEYHTYCLKPPLTKVPSEKWHCPSCVSKRVDENVTSLGNSAKDGSGTKSPEQSTGFPCNTRKELVSLLENKDYWEFSTKERVLLLKFLSDELLNSASFRHHLERCTEESADLPQKLRFAFSDLRNKKLKEERLAEKLAKTRRGSRSKVTELYENASGDPTENNIGLNAIKKDIIQIRDSICRLEMQLMNLSGRREFLGADSEGRLFWLSANLRRLCIIVNDVRGTSPWLLYESPSEINHLVDFLRDDDPLERELKEAISQRWNIEDEYQCYESEIIDESKSFLGLESPVTKAAVLLESTYGPWIDQETAVLSKQGKQAKPISNGKLYRCLCSEPVLPSKYHCLYCHKTFLTRKESDGHTVEKCRADLAASKPTKAEKDGLVCPHNFEDICSRFSTKETLKDLVTKIGSFGSNAIPLLLSSLIPNLNEPAVMVESSSEGELADDDKPETPSLDMMDPNSFVAINGCYNKSTHMVLEGRALDTLVQLKRNLLDMEAALPKTAIKPSRSCIKRRWAWRSFVKSAGSIDQMVQAVIVFEDMIRPDHLQNGWWFWSSLSAAANITSLSALALRIYSLDANIIYENSVDKSDAAAEGVVLSKKLKRKSSA